MIPSNIEVKFSKHAKERLQERNLTIEDALEALKNPVQVVYDSWNDVYIAVSVKGHAVVYAFRGSIIEVVTVLGEREYNALMAKYGVKRYKIVV